MRMRKKPNLIHRMQRCASVQIFEPENFWGKWDKQRPFADTLWLELGCGKGKFTVRTAAANSDALMIAVEKVPEAIVVAMERAVAENLENTFFVKADVDSLTDFFAPGEVDRIYINFCDPWPSKKHAKRRLTSPAFLSKYKQILKPDGCVHFKTDNQDLFEYSIEQFQACGFDLSEVTRDLHEHEVIGELTDYEEKFLSQGIKICRCVTQNKN